MHAARGWARRSVAVGWKWRVMHSMDAEDALRLYVGGTGATAPHAMSNKLTPAACKFRGSARDTACREHKAGAHKAKGHAISRSRKKSSSPSQAALRQAYSQHLRGERACPPLQPCTPTLPMFISTTMHDHKSPCTASPMHIQTLSGQRTLSS